MPKAATPGTSTTQHGTPSHLPGFVVLFLMFVKIVLRDVDYELLDLKCFYFSGV